MAKFLTNIYYDAWLSLIDVKPEEELTKANFLEAHNIATKHLLGRLLEKWFLTAKLGEQAWYIPSEYYYNNIKFYYANLAHVGLFYEELKYEKGMPFLLMLPNSLILD